MTRVEQGSWSFNIVPCQSISCYDVIFKRFLRLARLGLLRLE
jgi:hypothetical protein